MVARLSHSQSIGKDRALALRFVVVDAEAYVQERTWLTIDWELLGTCARDERDLLAQR